MAFDFDGRTVLFIFPVGRSGALADGLSIQLWLMCLFLFLACLAILELYAFPFISWDSAFNALAH